MRGTKRVLVSICLVMVLGLSLPFMGACQEQMEYKIGITQIISHAALDSAREGFISAMAEEGFVEGENVRYIRRNAEGDMSTAASIAEYFVSERVDMILSIATPTSQAVVSAVQGTNIPVVFNSVTEPKDAGLVDEWDAPGGQVTGVSDMAAVEPQLELIKKVVPDATRLGVVYNAGEANSVVQVNMLKDAIGDFGMSVTEATAASTADVLSAAQSLEGRVDVIWVPACNTAVAGIDSIIKVGEDYNIPVFAADVATVEKGAIGCYGINYTVVGEESGKIAARILKGEDPADIPVMMIDLDELYLNKKAAANMGVTLPQDILDQATTVIE